jgi:hypothetical protein
MNMLAKKTDVKLAIFSFETVRGKNIKAREKNDIENASSLPSKVKS